MNYCVSLFYSKERNLEVLINSENGKRLTFVPFSHWCDCISITILSLFSKLDNVFFTSFQPMKIYKAILNEKRLLTIGIKDAAN